MFRVFSDLFLDLLGVIKCNIETMCVSVIC